MMKNNDKKVGFDKVIGYEELKAELKIMCDAINNPENYKKLGVSTPRGVLLYGAPGIGKSLMAKAFLEECKRKAFTIRKDKPDGEFVKHITEVFEEAKAEAPSIVFLDDMDKFANGDAEHKDAEEFVTVQACIEAAKDIDLFVIATVNDKGVLPDSLIRTGRFDKIIEMDCPEGEDSEKIVRHFLEQKQISEDVDAVEIARILEDKSCADLETIINAAGMYAAYERRDVISHHDLIRSCLRYVFEAPEEIECDDSESRRGTAIHEAGHVVIAEILEPGSVNLASISGHKGNIGGITSIHTPKDYWYSKELREHRVIGVLGGKAATEIVCNTVDTGIKSDIWKAFKIVRLFVQDFCTFGFDSFPCYDASEITRENRDRAIAKEVERYYRMAKEIITKNRSFLDAVVEALLEKQTITGKDIREIKEKLTK